MAAGDRAETERKRKKRGEESENTEKKAERNHVKFEVLHRWCHEGRCQAVVLHHSHVRTDDTTRTQRLKDRTMTRIIAA